MNRVRRFFRRRGAGTGPGSEDASAVAEEITHTHFAGPGDLRFRLPEAVAKPRPDLCEMGEHSYSKPHVLWFPGDTAKVTIGRYCSINANAVVFVGGEHDPRWITTYPLRPRWDLPGAFQDGQPMPPRGDVEIGNDVWIGWLALILSGVKVGDGAVIGAGSVVREDVPPYSIAIGNPARVVKERFTQAEREALLRIRWWDWPDEKVQEEVAALSSRNVSEFVARHDPGPR